jgi:STE24 endopeptidase
MVESPEVTLDPERQESAREYARVRRRLLVVDLAVAAVLVIGFLVTGASRGLKAVLLSAGLTSPWLLVGAYVALVFVGYTLVASPLAWWNEYFLPHRYELSTQTWRSWLVDQFKALALGLVLGVPVVEVVYWLLRNYPALWWVPAGVFLIAFAVLLSHLAPVLIVPLFYKLTPLADEELVARIQRLAEKTGTRVVGVYTIDLSSRTRAANALVMGLGRTKRIALGDTLYADYSPDEIEAIIAHELGHQVHHDLELAILVQSLLLLGGLYLAHLFLSWGVDSLGFEGPGDVAALPLLVLAAGLFSIVTLPLINAYSRWRERLADRFAIKVTDDPHAFARAMTRLANQNLAEADPPRWVVWLLYSHPPIRERVAAAMGEH